ncbi:hypothetical protein DE146DRAFT_240187 [Phaeosphaeria sp. MPI-PUGE-AT-0046c]|nr:hypothetical protein DE146DRAFT_240187 [Phaeosphaeria sp. MPI-PUGE-AT-0046c]
MALEVSAAIIGILAAAGKVAETLGPVVSAFVDAPKHANTLLIEVRYTRTILLGLQTLFDELSAVPQRRKQLIQIDQLVATLTDGVLLFSELESLVDKLGDPNDVILSRAKWARKDHELASIVKRLFGFKTSMALMLGILRCESDLVAQYDRQVLLENTANILKNNIELAQRLAHLESQLDATHSVTTKRAVSIASTSLDQQIPGITTTTDVTPRVSMQPDDGARVFQFEPVLKASRVYRRAKRDTADYSFCSSIPLSHAWTALSDMSLGDISIISVIALPVEVTEIANADRYEFTNWPLPSGEDSVSLRPKSQHSISTPWRSSLLGATPSAPLPSIEESPLSPAIAYSRSGHVQIAVIGAPMTDVNDVVARFTSPPYQLDDPQNLFNQYDKCCTIDGVIVRLALEAVNTSSEAFNAGLHLIHFAKHDAFMLVYASTSRSSFDKVADLIRQVRYIKNSFNDPPMMLVGIHNDELYEEHVPESEGHALAWRYDISFRTISATHVESLHDTFFQLVRQTWAFEAQNFLPPLPRLPLPLEKAKIESQKMVPKPRRRDFLRRRTENDRLQVVKQPALGAIQEV